MNYQFENVLFYAAFHKNLELVQECLTTGYSPKYQNIFGKTAFHYAAHNQQFEIIQLLLKKNYDPTITDIWGSNTGRLTDDLRHQFVQQTGIRIIDEHKTKLESIVHDNLPLPPMDVNAFDEKGNTPLIWAIFYGNEPALHRLLQLKCDVNLACKRGQTPLMMACRMWNRAPFVRELIAKGAHINAITPEGYSSLSYADCDQSDTVDFLLRNGATINHSDNWKLPILVSILSHSNDAIAVCTFWLEKGININCTDVEGNTALGYACLTGNLALVQFLIAKGANVNTFERHGKPPLAWAIIGNSLEVVKALIAHKACKNTVDAYPSTALIYAARYDRQPIAKYLLELGAEIDTKDRMGKSAVTFAVLNNDIELVKLLVAQDADLLQKDNGNLTPLSHACKAINVKMVQYLVMTEAKLTVHSALPIAIHADNIEIIDLLLKNGAYCKEVQLGELVSKQKYEVVELLVRNGTEPNQKYRDKSVLLMAIEGHQLKFVELFLKYKIESKTIDSLFQTAADLGDYKIIKLLLDNGAKASMTHLNVVLKLDDVQVMKLLIDNGAIVDEVDENNKSLLQNAIDNNQIEIVKLLLHSKRVKAALVQDAFKQAIAGEKMKIVLLFLANGAQVNQAIGDESDSPLFIAGKTKRFKLIKILFDHGAKIDLKSQNELDNLAFKNIDFKIYLRKYSKIESDSTRKLDGPSSAAKESANLAGATPSRRALYESFMLRLEHYQGDSNLPFVLPKLWPQSPEPPKKEPDMIPTKLEKQVVEPKMEMEEDKRSKHAPSPDTSFKLSSKEITSKASSLPAGNVDFVESSRSMPSPKVEIIPAIAITSNLPMDSTVLSTENIVHRSESISSIEVANHSPAPKSKTKSETDLVRLQLNRLVKTNSNIDESVNPSNLLYATPAAVTTHQVIEKVPSMTSQSVKAKPNLPIVASVDRSYNLLLAETPRIANKDFTDILTFDNVVPISHTLQLTKRPAETTANVLEPSTNVESLDFPATTTTRTNQNICSKIEPNKKHEESTKHEASTDQDSGKDSKSSSTSTIKSEHISEIEHSPPPEPVTPPLPKIETSNINAFNLMIAARNANKEQVTSNATIKSEPNAKIQPFQPSDLVIRPLPKIETSNINAFNQMIAARNANQQQSSNATITSEPNARIQPFLPPDLVIRPLAATADDAPYDRSRPRGSILRHDTHLMDEVRRSIKPMFTVEKPDDEESPNVSTPSSKTGAHAVLRSNSDMLTAAGRLPSVEMDEIELEPVLSELTSELSLLRFSTSSDLIESIEPVRVTVSVPTTLRRNAPSMHALNVRASEIAIAKKEKRESMVAMYTLERTKSSLERAKNYLERTKSSLERAKSGVRSIESKTTIDEAAGVSSEEVSFIGKSSTLIMERSQSTGLVDSQVVAPGGITTQFTPAFVMPQIDSSIRSDSLTTISSITHSENLLNDNRQDIMIEEQEMKIVIEMRNSDELDGVSDSLISIASNLESNVNLNLLHVGETVAPIAEPIIKSSNKRIVEPTYTPIVAPMTAETDVGSTMSEVVQRHYVATTIRITPSAPNSNVGFRANVVNIVPGGSEKKPTMKIVKRINPGSSGVGGSGGGGGSNSSRLTCLACGKFGPRMPLKSCSSHAVCIQCLQEKDKNKATQAASDDSDD